MKNIVLSKNRIFLSFFTAVIVAVLLSLNIVPGFQPPVFADEVVTFPDPNLEAVIREAIDKPTGDILDTDLLPLTTLKAENKNISDLTGLEYCLNLTYLEIPINQIGDISPLENLTNLEYLYLSANQISDILPLAGLTDLTTLYLYNNQISDISPLQNLINLTVLPLSQNQIVDISPLVANSGIDDGDSVYLTNNPLSAESLYLYIPELQARGVTVDYDEQPLSVTTNAASDITDTSATLNGNLDGLGSYGAIIDVSFEWSDTLGGPYDETPPQTMTETGSFSAPLSGLNPSTPYYYRAKATNGTTVYGSELTLTTNGIVVTFPDPNLEAVIREAIVKPTGDILDTDLLPLYALGAEDKNISDLTGLEYCINLSYLSLSNNQISGIPPLGDLTSLQYLYLSNNQIGDISPLAGLTNLTTLYLSQNQINDISALAGLTNLTSLLLSQNQINDISALAGLTNLTILFLSENQISDISALANLTNLTQLVLFSNQISNISVVQNLTGLQVLSLWDNQINDLSPLQDCINLTELLLAQNQISDISVLVNLGNLVTITFTNNQISDISPLADLTNLEDISLNTNQISDISPLADLTNLDWVFLSNNQISDISPLAGLTGLTQLTLDTNQISDISALADLTNLEQLFLYTNQIGDISAIADLTNLEQLYLSNNQISDISPLAGLIDLTTLHLYSNQISDISPLQGLTNLTTLYLYNNLISDIIPLVNNLGINTGDTLFITGNPLSLESLYIHIPELQARGVTVDYDEQPVSVITNAASDITDTSATLNGNLDSLGAHTSMDVSFEWSETSGGPYTETTPQTMTTTGTFNSSLDGLDSGTRYYFRAKAVGVTTFYGEEQEFYTAGNVPPTAPVVDVTPNLPLTGDDLVCTVTTESIDPNGSTVTYTYEWYKDGVLQPDETTATTALTDTVSSALTAPGDTWRCVVTPNDGIIDGPSAEDQTIIVETLVTDTITDDIIDATGEADTEVVVTGTATVTVAKYADNPGSSFNGDIGKYIDVYIDDTSGVTEIEIRLYYTDAEISGKVESSLKLQWWNGTVWAECSDSGVNTGAINGYSGYIWAIINDLTTPSLDDLTGTPFGAKASPVQSPGGGGGGGGMPAGVTFFTGKINTQGKFTEDITARSADKKVSLLISKGTVGKTSKGAPLSWVSIQTKSDFPVPMEYLSMISLPYDVAPYRATFDPDVKIMISYNPSKLDAAIDELDLTIYTYDEQIGQWVPLESHVDPEDNTVWAEISHFSLYTVMVSTRPADISVENLTITPEEIYEGEDATVEALLVNSGDSTGTYEAILRIDGNEKETKAVEVSKRDSVAVSFDLAGLEYGTYQIAVGEVSVTLTVLEIIVPAPAAFTISTLEITPEEVDIGENVNVSVRVDNTGESEGVYQVVCKVNSVVVDEKEVTLAGGSGESVVFTTTFDEAGNQTIEVNGLTGSLVVKELEEEPSPEPGTVAEIPTAEIPEEPASTSGSYWWIIGLVLGVCALIVIGFLVRAKRGYKAE